MCARWTSRVRLFSSAVGSSPLTRCWVASPVITRPWLATNATRKGGPGAVIWTRGPACSTRLPPECRHRGSGGGRWSGPLRCGVQPTATAKQQPLQVEQVVVGVGERSQHHGPLSGIRGHLADLSPELVGYLDEVPEPELLDPFEE